ncbi:hypothetical protein K470DRAFT_209152 [Piedraia hortae CBS 480.64]|uniref:Protein-lysine N-methyltransferase EFM5 n=1 Tax=Piedraia hortae CBS 480.64 TaxID=1314780 RepID=A0A6A7CCV2_9PEZI|nr:hypothetical protein K470DRAFT_209152 [Piedraia hortae CBS 480.64]
MDEEKIELPADTLALLQGFLCEKEAQDQRFQEMQLAAEKNFDVQSGKLTMSIFGEDWNISQFWYSEQTSDVLAQALVEGLHPNAKIAVISAPSAYVALKNTIQSTSIEVKLLEYDPRFAVFGKEFVQYDYNHPLRLPAELKRAFDCVIIDPPFLSDDCQTKMALTVRFLVKQWSKDTKLVACTGERMSALVQRLYSAVGIKVTSFEPEHGRGLSNEFRCYANFECKGWRLL